MPEHHSLQTFASAEDIDDQRSKLLAQYQASILSALRPALLETAHVDEIRLALQLCGDILTRGAFKLSEVRERIGPILSKALSATAGRSGLKDR